MDGLKADFHRYFVTLCLGIASLNAALKGQPTNLRRLWQTGFGAVNGNNLLTIKLPLVGGVLFANIPQVLLSYMYVAFNALYTNMFISYEWSTYVDTRKPLRVTSPVGQQRDTYWLNVPFRFAIPLTIVSGAFHWLASQSLFMVRITTTDLDAGTRTYAGQISTCGYSPMAIILTLVVAGLIAIYGIAIAQWRYASGVPLVGSNSAGISAACQAPTEAVDASLQFVQWGAVTHGTRGSNGEEAVGHCSFSSLPVEPPIVGRLYA